MLLHMGLDVGSTTVKLVALDDEGRILYSTYQRHFSDMKKTVSRKRFFSYRKNVVDR